MSTTIGLLRETSLHASLKQLYARPGDLVEAKVGKSIIDIVRGDQLIEIQTRNFSSLKGKLASLLDVRPIRVVYPIAISKTILRIANDEKIISRRKSPEKGRVEMIFNELIRIAGYVKHPNFSLEVAFIEEEVVWIDNGMGSWRRGGWSVEDRRLIKLIDCRVFSRPRDYDVLLPFGINELFTSHDLSQVLHLRKNLAHKMIYSLRGMDIIVQAAGKNGRYNLYSHR
jgi:hypothetical protein